MQIAAMYIFLGGRASHLVMLLETVNVFQPRGGFLVGLPISVLMILAAWMELTLVGGTQEVESSLMTGMSEGS